MRESPAESALRNGDAEAAGAWVRSALPALGPEALAAPAVRHPLEFVCLPLHRSHRVGLCLHVWTGSGEVSSSVVHAHSWDLWSYVVQGTVLNQIVDVRDEPEAPDFELYTVASTGTKDEVRTSGRRVVHAPRPRQEVPAGRIYRITSGLFHRSGHRGPTATLVLGEQHEGLENLFLGPLNGYRGANSSRVRCSPAEVRALLRAITPRGPAGTGP